MRDLTGQRVLITGASGFIGSHLVRELVGRGVQVQAIVRPESDLWRLEDVLPDIALERVDLADGAGVRDVVCRLRPTLVVNLVAHGGHPSSAGERAAHIRAGVLGVSHLIGALEELPVERLVHVGSALEYAPLSRALVETDAIAPTSFRGVAKAAATLLCLEAAARSSLPVVVLRLFHVYGPAEAEGRLVPTVVRAALRGGEVALTAAGARRDFVFVGDVVDAGVAALEAPDAVNGEVVNVGSGCETANDELVDAVRAVSGRPVDVRVAAFPARPTDAPHRCADIRKAGRLLGWHPTRTLEEGLSETFEWFQRREEVRDRIGV